VKDAKRRKLEAAGWRVGSTDDFLDQGLKKDQLICPRCSKPFIAKSCGITHSLIAKELGGGGAAQFAAIVLTEDPYGKPQLRRLKQRITNALWELPPGARKKIGEAIDAWAIVEKKR